MAEPFSINVGESELRLDLFLSRQTGQSRMFVQTQIKHGRIEINGKTAAKASLKLRCGDRVSGFFKENVGVDLVPIHGDLDILFEDDQLIILNKAQGVVVHPAAGHRGETLVHHLLYHLRQAPGFTSTSPSRPGIVHRLDRGTSGVLVIAKNRTSLEELARQFKSRLVKKEYESVVWGNTKPEGSFSSAIGRDHSDRKKMSSKTFNGREALTLFKRVRDYKHFSHVALFPFTGRTHQLRVHLSENGTPIVGDSLYERRFVIRRLETLPTPLQSSINAAKYPFLHARALTLIHPTSKQTMAFTALRPAAFDRFLTDLENFD